MKSFINILIALCLSATLTTAQDARYKDNPSGYAAASFQLTDSMPIEFITDISTYASICNPNAFELFEKKGNLNFVQKPFSADAAIKPFFQPVNEITILFSINNSTAREKAVYFKCGKPDLFKLTCLDDGSHTIQTGGFLGKTNRISPFSPNKYLVIQIPPNTTRRWLAYVKFMGSYREKVTPTLLSEKSYQLNSIRDIDRNRLQLVYHSFIMGGIFIISIFMCCQFFLNRDKTYLYYAAYGFLIFLLSEKIMEHNCGIYLISYFFPTYIFYSHVILQLLASFFYIRFVNGLLKITREDNAIYTYSSVMQKMILLGCVFYGYAIFINENSILVSVAFNYGALLSTFCMLPLLVLLLLIRKKDLAVKFVIAGFCAIVIAAVCVVCLNRSGLNIKFTYLAPVSIVEFGIFLEMIFFGLALGYKTYKQKEEKENMELQKKETEMAALRAQMNPHFMFNCISSIDGLIQNNEKYNATNYLNKFAKLMRNVLEGSKENTIAFSKDIETLKLYLDLEQLRNENKYNTQLIVSEELLNSAYVVPPLIIQPFVENAILHGLKNRPGNSGILTIEISKEDDNLVYVISDNGVGRAATEKDGIQQHKSFGVQMSTDRIKLFNKEEFSSVKIEDRTDNGLATGTIVTVKLKLK